MTASDDVLFEVQTPIGFRVRVTRERWKLIATVKHSVMVGRELSVKATLESPEEFDKVEASRQSFFSTKRNRQGAGFVPSRSEPKIMAS